MKTINIPQGYSGIVNREPSAIDINGLYTRGFSTCNIVICISTSQLFLMHVGVNDTANLLADLKKVKGELLEIHVLYRPDVQLAWIIRNNIITLLTDTIGKEQNIKVQAVAVQPDKEDVLICMQQDGQILIQLDDQEPDFLLRHPHELQIETVEKIRQVIGIRSRERLKDALSRKVSNIFDGVAWTKIPENQLVIDDGTEETRAEMQSFAASDGLEEIVKKLYSLLDLIETRNIFVSAGIDIFDIAMHIELYLNKYDYALVFKRDLMTILKLSRLEPSTQEDNKFVAEMRAIGSGIGDVHIAAAERIEQYTENAPQTDYKTYILKQFEVISSLYAQRLKYNILLSSYDSWVIEATSKNKEAREYFQKRQYSGAANLFLDASKLLTYSCLEDDTKLKATLFSYNAALQHAAGDSEVKNDKEEMEPETQKLRKLKLG